ncbi:MAG TPA: PqqD family protein [Pyrinomonadaceae bacterium]|nr:PqqD family protein [Pyrinomonadaceae bacterium]
MNASATPHPHSHIVYTEFDGREAVLVDLNTKRYYTLNETAMLVWLGLERGQTTSEIAREICDRYDVSEEHAAESIKRLLTSLGAHRLLA